MSALVLPSTCFEIAFSVQCLQQFPIDDSEITNR